MVLWRAAQPNSATVKSGGCFPHRHCHRRQPRPERLRLGRRRVGHPHRDRRPGQHAHATRATLERRLVLLRLRAARRRSRPARACSPPPPTRPTRACTSCRSRAGRDVPRLLRPDQQRSAVDAAAPRHRQRRLRVPRLCPPSGLGPLPGGQRSPGGGDRPLGSPTARVSAPGLSPVSAARPAAQELSRHARSCTSPTSRFPIRRSCG